jgi:hypothetical protein
MVTSLPVPQLNQLSSIPNLPPLLRSLAQQRLQSYVQQYKEFILPLVESFPSVFHQAADFSFEKYSWARAIFESRNWMTKIGGEKVNVMGAMADLFNMCRDADSPTTIGFESYRGEFFVMATEEVGEGKEVCHHYGKKCSEQSLVTYGFSLPEQDSCLGWASPLQKAQDELDFDTLKAEIDQFEQASFAKEQEHEERSNGSTHSPSWMVRTFQSAQRPFDALEPALRKEWDDVRSQLLLEWALNSGIKLAHIEQDMFLKGEAPDRTPVRGMRASAKIGAHTKLVRLPFDVLLSRFTVQASPIGHVLEVSLPIPN